MEKKTSDFLRTLLGQLSNYKIRMCPSYVLYFGMLCCIEEVFFIFYFALKLILDIFIPVSLLLEHIFFIYFPVSQFTDTLRLSHLSPLADWSINYTLSGSLTPQCLLGRVLHAAAAPHIIVTNILCYSNCNCQFIKYMILKKMEQEAKVIKKIPGMVFDHLVFLVN